MNDDIAKWSAYFVIFMFVVSVAASFVFRSKQEKKFFVSDDSYRYEYQNTIRVPISLNSVIFDPDAKEVGFDEFPLAEPKEEPKTEPLPPEKDQTAIFLDRLLEEVGGEAKFIDIISDMDKKNKESFSKLLEKTFQEFRESKPEAEEKENQ